MRRQRARRVKQAIAWTMAGVSAAGVVATQVGLVGSGEPKLVLQLSWLALFFSGLDALLIVDD